MSVSSFRRRFGTLPASLGNPTKEASSNNVTHEKTNAGTKLLSLFTGSSSSSSATIATADQQSVQIQKVEDPDQVIADKTVNFRTRARTQDHPIPQANNAKAEKLLMAGGSIRIRRLSNDPSFDSFGSAPLTPPSSSRPEGPIRINSSPIPKPVLKQSVPSSPKNTGGITLRDSGITKRKSASPSREETDIFDEAAYIKDRAKIAELVVALWQSPTEEVQCDIFKKLRRFTLKETNFPLMRHAGVLRYIADSIKRFDASVQTLPEYLRNALILLAALIKNALNADDFSRYKLLPKLLEILKHPAGANSMLEVVIIITELSKIDSNKIALKKTVFLPTIIPMVKTTKEAGFLIALLDAIYCNVDQDSANQEIAVKANAVEILSMHICHELIAVKHRAIRTLGVVVENNALALKSIKKEPATIGFLIKNLITDTGEMLEASAYTIARIVENDAELQSFVHKGYIWTPLDRLLKSSEGELQAYGMALLHALVKGNNAIQNEFRKKETLLPLVLQNLTSSSMDLRLQSLATVLEIIRNNSDNQKEVFKSPIIIPAVLSALGTNNPTAQYLAMGIVWALAKKSGSRKKALIESGINAQIIAIGRQSHIEQIKRAAEWAEAALAPKGVLGGYLSSFVDKELFLT